MPMINIQMLSGRTPAQKRALIAGVAEVAMQTLDVPADAIRIILAEVAPEHWAMGGRSMAELRSRPGAIAEQEKTDARS
jgi:4-oxalocrotonate tautomerase